MGANKFTIWLKIGSVNVFILLMRIVYSMVYVDHNNSKTNVLGDENPGLLCGYKE